ncbi:hypothetical protein L3V31_08650 [Vibrio sp. J1-1]|uniref:hypothetical protein n=1 Tax=Vibrio sp. J1-1 TaxID=2912251 RepID=UPI001D7B2CCE|nr:hypothetical protein [Vibrio sp. J1-1]MBR9786971.1 hypothetical protein [Vibrionaceae bacterium]MCF7481798.1 hypothetical protein [Vibrio sp. J1-1]
MRSRENGVDYQLSAEQRCTKEVIVALLEAYWMATVAGAQSLRTNTGTIAQGQLFDVV